MLTSVSLKPQRSTSVGANHAWRKSLAKIAHKVVAPPATSFRPVRAGCGPGGGASVSRVWLPIASYHRCPVQFAVRRGLLRLSFGHALPIHCSYCAFLFILFRRNAGGV